MAREHWVRSQRAAAVDVGERLVLIGGPSAMRAIEGDGAAVAREVLAFVGKPQTVDAIVAHVTALSGGEAAHTRAIVEQLLDLLSGSGALVRATEATAGGVSASGPNRARRGNIVVGVSGALAATGVPAFVAALQRRGWTVEVALTEAARRFVSADALAVIVQREVHVAMWPAAPHAPVPHVALAEWADLVVVYPASATTLSRLAHGEFSDVVAAVALTTRAPVVLVPSMNSDMLSAAAVARNLETLRADGFAIVHGVPAEEAAEAPAVRDAHGSAAPSPADVAATIDSLVTGNVLARRGGSTSAAQAWDEMYRRPLVPWASERCDDDVAGALVHHAPPPGRLLDVGCGLGQIARHAAGLGYRVVATDVSEIALARARAAGGDDIVWLRDDICATTLAGPFEVIVDRASAHVLPPARLGAWAASIERLAGQHATLIVKAHADKLAFVQRLSGFEIVEDTEAELPGLVDATPIPSRLIVLRR